jgi:MFS-type transporter involved in bile tolerance (Atg22 family)
MTESNKSPVPRGVTPVFTMKMATVGGEVGCATLLIVLVAVFGGIWLDKVLGTKPILTILFVIGSGPVALFTTFWLAMRAVKDIQPVKKVGAPADVGKEEEVGE